MSVEAMLDTNILVYVVSTGEGDAAKKQIAIDLIRETNCGLSAQVLQEFYTVVVRKGRRPMGLGTALALMDQWTNLPLVATDADLIYAAIRISQRYKISYWDGAILAAAQRLGAKTLYTEDLNHGQTYGDVCVCNPFKQ